MKASRPLIVVMGVAGAGKSLVGAALARRMAVSFCEGDALHPRANIARMAAGQPLGDADRAPWLDRVAAWIAAHPHGGVVSCSALKRRYRDRLRAAGTPRFVLLDPPRAVLVRRLAERRDHFMPASLLVSQLDALERPDPDEGALVLGGDEPVDALVEEVVRWLETPPPRRG